MTLALSCPRCGQHQVAEARRAHFGVRCPECDEFMEVERGRPPGRSRAPKDVYPWRPWQILVVSVLFGPGACGAVAGFNFVRLGKRQYLIPSVVVGFVLCVVVWWFAVFLVPYDFHPLLGLLTTLAVGWGFMMVQKPFFDLWRLQHLSPNPEDQHRPKGLGQLLLVCLVSLGLEIGLVFLLADLWTSG